MEFDYAVDLGLEWPEGRNRRKSTDTVIIHHTVGSYGTPERWRKLHESRVASPSHRGVSYNYLVLQDGTVYIGRGLEYEGGSVRNDRTNNLNGRCVAIALDGDMRDELLPSPEQLKSALKLTRDVIECYGLPVTAVLGHNEVPVYEGAKPTGALYPTLCPCMDMNAFRQSLCGRIYTVQKGDTLYSIAKRLLGSALKYRDIMEINKLGGTLIREGETLILPDNSGKRELYLTDPMMRGEDVKGLQERLVSLGYAVGEADGIFGIKTDAAVRLFKKRAAALTANGVADEEMRLTLGL